LGNLDDLARALEGAEAVVHLARVRFPYTSNGYDPATGLWHYCDISGDAEKFSRNVTMTYNILATSVAADVKKIVCGSSLAIYGLYYPLRPIFPDYLPVDEDHPIRPQDPYGASKLVGENLCDAFARKSDVQIASLRFAGIASEAQYPILLERQKDPLCRGTGAFWSYIDVRDAAIACRLALEKDLHGSKRFNICAQTTILKEDTSEIVLRYLPQVKIIKHGPEKNWSGYDSTKAETILGFQATHLLPT
jgi:nucleoside-diphosphate-sugar epimerase